MLTYVCFLTLFLSASCRIHNLDLKNDSRGVMTLSTFGFLKKGTLVVNVTLFSYRLHHPPSGHYSSNAQFGFTLSKTDNTGVNDYLGKLREKCILSPNNLLPEAEKKTNVVLITLELDDVPQRLRIQRLGEDVKNLQLVPTPGWEDQRSSERKRRRRAVGAPTGTTSKAPTGTTSKAQTGTTSKAPTGTTSKAPTGTTSKAPTGTASKAPTATVKVNTTNTSKGSTNAASEVTATPEKSGDVLDSLPIISYKNGTPYSFTFQMTVTEDCEEGLYNLYFHNCMGAAGDVKDAFDSDVSLTMHIIEDNNGNYLGAGEMPLPNLYFALCCVFFAMGGLWLAVLRKSRDDVFKIHFLMLTVVYLKCLSLLFHAIHYHFIENYGTQQEAWAVLYYIAYLMKVTLLFLTILLIGAGWAFVKHLLSEKEKKLFIIFIPLQILANVAFIIVEESEEGTAIYTTWKEIFILVDLLCCGAILFPVVWSIRHLQEASQTDGKAAINLSKLKLFRHFYMLVVCYIYFTRIIVYLLQITVPFKYSWFDELFKQVAVVIFFVVTGMKFRPASDNPYLQVPTDSDDDEIEMEEVLTKSAVLDTVVKVNRHESMERETTANKRESSHEYD